MNKSSFTAASTFPAKIFCDDAIIKSVKDHKIIPYHIQVNPTNKCNLNCGFCSCANRDRSAALGYDDLMDITKNFQEIGTRAVTITGGGEPLMYPEIERYLCFLDSLGIKSALTTNGLLLNKVDKRYLGMLTWCRISLSDDSKINYSDFSSTEDVAIDWSFSYVISNKKANYSNLIGMIEFANKNHFTHVRIVDDIIDNKNNIEKIKSVLLNSADCSRVVWQGRKEYAVGSKRCLLSLLKPNITPMGYLVGCCGIQFASNPPMLDWPKTYSMGKDIKAIYDNQDYFDGSKCMRCYYSEYNNVLNAIWDSSALNHKEFL